MIFEVSPVQGPRKKFSNERKEKALLSRIEISTKNAGFPQNNVAL